MDRDISVQLSVAEALLQAAVPDDLAALSRAIGTLRRFGEAEELPIEQRTRATALADALAKRALEDVRRRYRTSVPKSNSDTPQAGRRRLNER